MLDETIALLKETDLAFTEIAKACEVTTRWLYKVLDGAITDPGVRRIERVHAYLRKAEEAA